MSKHAAATAIDIALTKSGVYVNPYLEDDGPSNLAKILAKVALAALREPTDAMLEAANRPYIDDDRDDPRFNYNTIITWQSMIDAVLKEGE